MKGTILNKSKELFLKHGVKTIGMDDIANALHISKKTIYQYFSSKDELVKTTLDYIYESAFGRVYDIVGKCETPIHEHFMVKKSIDDFFGQETNNSVCFFQLKKYYPELAYRLKKRKYDDNHKITSQNLIKGIKQGLYRKDIDIDFVCSQYFAGSMAFQYDEEFSGNGMEHFSHSEFDKKFLEHYLRAIVTEKGLKILENILQENHKNEI